MLSLSQLNQLKSDLRDVLYSHKWTPDAYLLAKAYITYSHKCLVKYALFNIL